MRRSDAAALGTKGVITNTTSMATSEIRHKTLSAFYTSIVNLRSALHLFPNDELVRPGDPVEYESLLSGCLVAARDESVNISRPDTGKENAGPTSKGSQQEAIDRVLEEVSRRDKNNVLLFGSKVSLSNPGLSMGIKADQGRICSLLMPFLSILPDRHLRIVMRIVQVLL